MDHAHSNVRWSNSAKVAVVSLIRPDADIVNGVCVYPFDTLFACLVLVARR